MSRIVLYHPTLRYLRTNRVILLVEEDDEEEHGSMPHQYRSTMSLYPSLLAAGLHQLAVVLVAGKVSNEAIERSSQASSYSLLMKNGLSSDDIEVSFSRKKIGKLQ